MTPDRQHVSRSNLLLRVSHCIFLFTTPQHLIRKTHMQWTSGVATRYRRTTRTNWWRPYTHNRVFSKSQSVHDAYPCNPQYISYLVLSIACMPIGKSRYMLYHVTSKAVLYHALQRYRVGDGLFPMDNAVDELRHLRRTLRPTLFRVVYPQSIRGRRSCLQPRGLCVLPGS